MARCERCSTLQAIHGNWIPTVFGKLFRCCCGTNLCQNAGAGVRYWPRCFVGRDGDGEYWVLGFNGSFETEESQEGADETGIGEGGEEYGCWGGGSRY